MFSLLFLTLLSGFTRPLTEDDQAFSVNAIQSRIEYRFQNQLSVLPPKEATTLFDGKDASSWIMLKSGKPCQWDVKNGEIVVVNGTGDLKTQQEFGDFTLHIEFNIPLMADAKGEARGNSGVILQNLYEIQILDSFGVKPPTFVDCGAVYRQTAPTVNACKAPEQWQTYDITFRAPRFDTDGKVTKNPRVTVLQNGIKIQDNVEITSATGVRKGKPMTKTGPIVLQDHHAKLKFRNIWIIPAKS